MVGSLRSKQRLKIYCKKVLMTNTGLNIGWWLGLEMRTSTYALISQCLMDREVFF